ncbi:tetratricopeptide repeat protein, partial [Tumebacillus permanentifrigoris]
LGIKTDKSFARTGETGEFSNGVFEEFSTVVDIRYIIGKNYYQKRDFTNALFQYQRAYDYTKRFEVSTSLTAKIAYNLGVSLRQKGFYNESIPYLEEAHHYFKTHNDLKTLAYTLFEKGISYKNAGKFEEAAKCFSESKVILETLELKSLHVILQHTVATEITLLEDPALAEEQLLDCLEMIRNDHNPQRELLICTKLVRVHMHTSAQDKQLEYLQRAERLIQDHQLEATVEAAEYYKMLAMNFIRMNQFNDVFEYALKSSELFGKMGLVIDQLESLQLVAEAYELVGNYKMALSYERLCKEIALDLRKG